MTDPITPPVETPAVEKPAEDMIPQSKFDEINTALKDLRAEVAKKEADVEAATKAAALAKAEEDKDFQTQLDLLNKDLEKEKVKSTSAQADKDALILSQLQVTVAAKHKLHADLASRLIGTTKAELEEDAKKLAKSLPASSSPTPADGKDGINPPVNPKMPDDETIKRLADQLGQSFSYMKTYYENLSKEK